MILIRNSRGKSGGKTKVDRLKVGMFCFLRDSQLFAIRLILVILTLAQKNTLNWFFVNML